MALDFPSSPTNGQIYGNYYYDASVGAWNSFSSVGNVIPSTLKNLTVTTDDVGVAPFTVKNSGGTMVANIDHSGTLSANSLTLTNNLTVANGGTGAGTFTSGAYLKGNGTSAIQAQTGIPFGDVNVVSIPAATDLNTYITQGIYHQNSNVNAAGGTNYPVPYAGLLEVFVPGTSFLYQRYTAYKDQYDVYTRAYYNGAWNAWQKLPSGTVTVAEGGTGATTLTSGAYLKGAGTSAITAQTGVPATDLTGTINQASLPAGTVIKVQYYTDSSVSNGTNTSYADVNANLRLSFTPLRTSSTIYVIASMSWLNEGTHTQQLRMLRDGSVSGLADINIATAMSGWNMYQGSFQWQDTLAHTAGTQVTFSFQTRVNSGNWYYNYNTALGPGRSMYTIWEVAA